MDTIKKIWAYYWNLGERKIERLEDEARHPFAKKFDKIFNNPLVGKRRMVPRRKKDVENN